MQPMVNPFERLTLFRNPNGRSEEPLQAWDAADELILSYLKDNQLPRKNETILIANDGFGALSCSLASFQPISWNDSSISHKTIKHNISVNQLSTTGTLLSSIDKPPPAIDLIILKIPKTLALLEYQLALLAPHCTPNTTVVAGGMVKYLQKSQQSLFERYLGPTTTSLAKKKARLLFSTIEEQRIDSNGIQCTPLSKQFHVAGITLEMVNYANVFSREKMDIGSRFFVEEMSNLPAADTVIDLGCGNGLLGIAAKFCQPSSQIVFLDESYMAVESARLSYYKNLPNDDSAKFYVSDCFQGYSGSQVDLILCNPPFHQGNVISEHISHRMISESRQQLKPGGKIWLIGNRHLNYTRKLKLIFGNSRVVSSNKKFVLSEATKAFNTIIDH